MSINKSLLAGGVIFQDYTPINPISLREKIWHIRIIVALVVPLSFQFFSCSSTPSVDFAKSNLQRIISPLQVQLTSFTKVNGAKIEVMGQKAYKMEVDASFKFPDAMQVSPEAVALLQNGHFEMIFVKTENGWVYSSGLPAFLDFNSP